jgi:hypothetical protein
MTATTRGEQMFLDVLQGLEITLHADGASDIGPITGPATDLVAEFVEQLLNANPALAEVVRRRLVAAPERDGLRVLQVADLLGVLETVAQHGAPPGYRDVVA